MDAGKGGPMMIDDLLQKQFAVARHRATVFGPHLDDYLAELRRAGHGRAVLRRNLFLVTRFGEQLATQGIADVASVRREHVAAFLGCERRRLGRSSGTPDRLVSVAGYIVSGFLDHLEVRGCRREIEKVGSRVIDDFYRSLHAVRGLQPRTIEGYRHFLDQFLRHLRSDGSADSFSRLTPGDVDGFIVSAGRTYGRKSMGLACTAIRALLRFLFRKAVLDRDLSTTVILPKFYALERLPCALPWNTVRRALDSVDARSLRGLRDRAILALLVTYGVRPGEIVKLRIEDIDWRSDTIHFHRSKSGRPLAFPLTVDVGEAIVRYLRHGRPNTTAREVFVRLDAPFVALSRGSVVSNLVRQYLGRAGIESQQTGAYVIRHSLAVHLIRKRHPLKTISDMLGHRDPRVAYHYTKLAGEDLHGVALDAREVLP
jgi:integrase/recombinase XerD